MSIWDLSKARLSRVQACLSGVRACLSGVRACLSGVRACLSGVRACLSRVWTCLSGVRACLKGLFTNFEYITFFSCPTKRNIFCKRSISIKPLWLEIIEKRGCTKSVRPSTIIYIIYIHGLTLCTLFSQLFRVRVVLSRWTFYKKCFFRWGTKKMLYIQNWWTIPLMKCYLIEKKMKSKLSIFCILSHYLISMIWNYSLLSYYPYGVGVSENIVGRKLLFWKKPLKKSQHNNVLVHIKSFNKNE